MKIFFRNYQKKRGFGLIHLIPLQIYIVRYIVRYLSSPFPDAFVIVPDNVKIRIWSIKLCEKKSQMENLKSH